MRFLKRPAASAAWRECEENEIIKELSQVLLEAKDEISRNRTLKVFTTSAPVNSSRLVFTEELDKRIDRLHAVISNNKRALLNCSCFELLVFRFYIFDIILNAS